MYYSKIKHFDIANGPGIRLSLFVSGCPFHCKGCFNSETWSFSNGQLYSQKTEEEIVQFFKDNPEVTGFSLLGGEPFARESLEDYRALIRLVQRLRTETQCNQFWVWSGHLIEDLVKEPITFELLSEFDVLVDGQFVECKKDLRLPYCGSTNQRVIDIRKSAFKKVVLWEDSHD